MTVAPGSPLFQEWNQFSSVPFDLFNDRLLRAKV